MITAGDFRNGDEEIKTRRVNPGMPIPAEASAIHGIYDADVKDEPKFEQLAKSLATWIEGCDLAGFNSSRFDIPLLAEEFLRAGVDIDFSKRKMIDVQTARIEMQKTAQTARGADDLVTVVQKTVGVARLIHQGVGLALQAVQ